LAKNLRRLLYLVAFVALLVVLFRQADDGPIAVQKDKLGYIEVRGVITASEELVDDIEALGDSPQVRGLLVRVDSPGGGVAPSQEIHAALRRFQAEHGKPVVISMGNVAASGGYYIACGARKIVANPGTLTGSIGVLMHFTQFAELLDRLGIDSQTIKSGTFKDIGTPTREMTDEERQLLEEVLLDVHGQFVAAIVEGRDLPEEAVRAVADGRIFSGQQAQALGLVDELGGLREAIGLAGAMTDLGPDPDLLRPQESGVRRLRQILGGGALGHLLATPPVRQGMFFLGRY
jgi:protease-4